MKYLFVFFLVFFMVSCQKGTTNENDRRRVECADFQPYQFTEGICNTLECTRYNGIWKELFMEKNEVSDAYFNEHVKILTTRINTAGGGETFQIWYELKLGWISLIINDGFVVRISTGNVTEGTGVPKETWLNKEQIVDSYKNVSKTYGGEERTPTTFFSKTEKFKFSSTADALNHLANLANASKLCYGSYFVDSKTGRVQLFAQAKVVENGKTITATLDMETGENTVEEKLILYN